MWFNKTNNESNSAGRPGLPRRHPHTAFMGLMGLALLGMTGWAFLHQATMTPTAQPGIAHHAPSPRVHARQHGG
jgi:hypothetical protein